MASTRETEQDRARATPSLGGTPEPRLQRYFCVEDDDCHGFARISNESKVLRREPKTVRVEGREVKGWIIELEVPATDGTVRIDPLADSGPMRPD